MGNMVMTDSEDEQRAGRDAVAKPDTDDGWFKVAYELLPPLMMCCQRMEASIVLSEVLAQVYGMEKRKAAKLKPAAIAERSGLARPNIWRGIKELTDKGILVRQGDGLFRFEKDYEKWRTADGPLVPPAMAGYFRKYLRIAKGQEPGNEAGASVSRVDTISEEPNGLSVSKGDTPPGDASVSKGDTPSVSRVDTVRVSKGDTLSVALPNRELETERVVVVDEGEPSDSRPLSESEPDNATRRPVPASRSPRGPDGKPLLWSMAPFSHDTAEVERTADLCGKLAGPEEDTIPGNVRRSARMYPLWYFTHSIRLGVVKGHRGGLWSFAVGIMQNLWKQGIIDEPEEAPAEPRPGPLGVYPRSAPAPSAATLIHDRETAKMRASIAAKKAAAERNTAS
jgi:hypothetical protein